VDSKKRDAQLNLLEVVATQPLVFGRFKAFWHLLVSQLNQAQRFVLNLIEGDDHFADTFLVRAVFDGRVELLRICSVRQRKCRVKPKFVSRLKWSVLPLILMVIFSG